MEKARDFIEFFSRSTFLQDVAFGTKTLKLSSGERIPIPSVVHTMTASKIIYLYHEECREHDVEPLKDRTCFCLLEVCSSSKQKSLEGLDNTSSTCEEALKTIASLVENLQSLSKMLGRLPIFTFLVLVPPAPGSMLDKTKLFLCIIVVTCPNIE